MRVLSVSRRTDVPAFYSEWLLRRLKAGFCHWLNPFGGQVFRVSLKPEDLFGLVFWTRNPGPLLSHLPEIESQGIPTAFLFTINGYPPTLEPRTPPPSKALETFRQVSRVVSPARMRWRYDPILLSSGISMEWHVRNFSVLARELEGFTDQVIVSFVDWYGKTRKNLASELIRPLGELQEPDFGQKQSLLHELSEICRIHHMSLHSCCDDQLLSEDVKKAHCIGSELLQAMRPGFPLSRFKKKPTRPGCGCLASTDIGAYHTCGHGCRYCYATSSPETGLANAARHDPNDTILLRPPHLVGVDLDHKDIV